MLPKTIDAKIQNIKAKGYMNVPKDNLICNLSIIEDIVYGTQPYNLMADYDKVGDIINDGGNWGFDK